MFTYNSIVINVLCQEYARVTNGSPPHGLFFGIFGVFFLAGLTSTNFNAESTELGLIQKS
jgi:hypothetical protein